MGNATHKPVGPAIEQIAPINPKAAKTKAHNNLVFVQILINTFTPAERMAWGREFYNAANPPR